MSLDNRRRVRVTGRYVPPAEGKAGGPCIIHTPPSLSIPPESPTVISIAPQPQMRLDEPRTGVPPVQGGEEGEDWSREAAPQPHVSYCEMGVPRHTMEELKSILKDSPLVSIQRRVNGKPGSPYTYLQGGSASTSGGPERPERPEKLVDDGKAGRMFSTFKPQADVSRRGPNCKENMSIQPHPTVDSSSPFRADANTNKSPGIRKHTQARGGSWEETGGSSSGW